MRCLNVAFDKEVTVRATFDNWATQTDIQAEFLSSCDSVSDRFTASIPFPMGIKSTLQFAISYKV